MLLFHIHYSLAIDYEAAEVSVPLYRAELAKSGRSKCSATGAAKHCKENLRQDDEEEDCTDLVAKGAEPELIAKNELRLGWLNEQSGNYGGWKHLRCWRVPHKVRLQLSYS